VRTIAAGANYAAVVGFVERTGGTFYNASAYVGPGSEPIAVYRKQHHWGAERSLLSSGTERGVVETPIGRTGLLTCYDLDFVAESVAFVRRNVDALLVTGAWPSAQAENWRLLHGRRAPSCCALARSTAPGESSAPDAPVDATFRAHPSWSTWVGRVSSPRTGASRTNSIASQRTVSGRLTRQCWRTADRPSSPSPIR
jgi:predicted amidohydrolase